MLLMSYVEMNQAIQEDIWFVDSGFLNHLSGNHASFYELNETFRETVKLENNSQISVHGKG